MPCLLVGFFVHVRGKDGLPLDAFAFGLLGLLRFGFLCPSCLCPGPRCRRWAQLALRVGPLMKEGFRFEL